jgi:hypothetical protein
VKVAFENRERPQGGDRVLWSGQVDVRENDQNQKEKKRKMKDTYDRT